MQQVSLYCTCLLAVLSSQPTLGEAIQPAQGSAPGKSTVGWVEKIELSIPVSGATPVKLAVEGKVDTGAQTSSLHAAGVKFIERNGQTFASFSVIEGKTKQRLELPVFRKGRVKSSDGNSEERPFVSVDMCLGNTVQKVEFSLNDRSSMRYPVLLGRSFLAGRYLVDSGQEFLLGNPACAGKDKP